MYRPLDPSLPLIRIECGSIAELIEAARKPCKNAANERIKARVLTGNGLGIEFHGMTPEQVARNSDGAEIERIIASGWREGYDRAAPMMNALEVPAVRSVRRVRTREDQGDELDLDALRAGNLERAWHRTRRASTKQPPMVHVVVCVTTNAAIDGSVLFWRGAAGAALAGALLAAGYSVKVSAMNAGEYTTGRNNFILTATVKDYRSPMDTLALVTACAMPAVTRSISYSATAAANPVKCDGLLCYSREIDPASITSPGERAVIVGTDVAAQSDAQAWISRTLAELAS